jgi:hypothetical protein
LFVLPPPPAIPNLPGVPLKIKSAIHWAIIKPYNNPPKSSLIMDIRVYSEMIKKALLLGNWDSIEGWLSNKQMEATWAGSINLIFGKYSIPFGPPKKVARIGGMTGRVFLFKCRIS